MRKILKIIPRVFVVPLFILGGLLCGLIAYTAYMARVTSYLSDDPSACVNCHIMAPYYQSWRHSSHAQWTNCVDCHLPQDSFIDKYMFKAVDGIYHSAVFAVWGETDVIRAREASSEVIMANCIRCHSQLNGEFVSTGMITFTDVKEGKGKACWDCHRQVPHTTVSNISSSPNAIAPMPKSPVPDWLKQSTEK